MTYEEWLVQVPDGLKNDPLWKFEACPKSLLLYDLAWEDTEKLLRDVRGRMLTAEAVRHRIALCDELIALLVVTTKQRRDRRRQQFPRPLL